MIELFEPQEHAAGVQRELEDLDEVIEKGLAAQGDVPDWYKVLMVVRLLSRRFAELKVRLDELERR